MKRAVFTSILLLVLATLVCVGSSFLIRNSLDRMTDLHEQVLACTDDDDKAGALDALGQTAEYWEKCGVWMEMLTSHEDLHNVREQIVSAKALLESDDMAQYQQCMALLREALDHIRRHESMNLSNIL